MEERINTEDQESTEYIQSNIGDVTELESMCTKCEENGITRLLMTHIPHFREIIISSFECKNPECKETNREIQFAGKFGANHVEYTLQVQRQADLNRQVVKSEYATVTIPELELEIPPETQKGQLNTVEGILRSCHDGLLSGQAVRQHMNPELASQIDDFCNKIMKYIQLEDTFTIKLSDPSGNSFIEALYDYYHPTIDPSIFKLERLRTIAEMQYIGLSTELQNKGFERTEDEENKIDKGSYGEDVFHVIQSCPACNNENGELRAHQCNIPYFKETLIMCFICEQCGYKSTEIKNGGALSPHGLLISLDVQSVKDFSRDVLKSDSAIVKIPMLDLELAPGTLGSFFTTIEGLISQIHDHLDNMRQLDFADGDSQVLHHGTPKESEGQKVFHNFMSKLKEMKEGSCFPFTIILDDPLANIYIQEIPVNEENEDLIDKSHPWTLNKGLDSGLVNPYGADGEASIGISTSCDPQITFERYERSAEMNEEFGINALVTLEESELNNKQDRR